jgi:hypothetical protein
MKSEIDELDHTFNLCIKKGLIKEKIPDLELIYSLKDVAEKGLQFIDKKSKDIAKDSSDWTFVFRDYYEALRGLIEAFLLFDGIIADNHQCKNAYVCIKYSELNLDWKFLETIRLKRNAINYRGILLNYKDWNIFKIKFDIHINILRRVIENRIT